jgi:membrane-associated protease RseP (regulator of RpoE activity)
MKRFTSRRCRTYTAVLLPAVLAFSCITLRAHGQSLPKLESPGLVVDSLESHESSAPALELPPHLETVAPRDEIDSDIELFTNQGEPVAIEPMSPEELESAPALNSPPKNKPAVNVVEPEQPLLPELEPAMPDLRDDLSYAPLPEPRYLNRPQLGVAGKLIRGWGFHIAEVFPGSAAERMQLERGDVILNINGQCISSIRSIEQQLARSAGEFEGQGIIKIDNVRGRTRCRTSQNRFLWLKFQL